jgi:hypothetical protein
MQNSGVQQMEITLPVSSGRSSSSIFPFAATISCCFGPEKFPTKGNGEQWKGGANGDVRTRIHIAHQGLANRPELVHEGRKIPKTHRISRYLSRKAAANSLQADSWLRRNRQERESYWMLRRLLL